MIIEVTQEDIENGDAGIAFSCPVALAINRTTGYYSSVWAFITLYEEYKHDGNAVIGISTPLHVWKWIRQFDEFHYSVNGVPKPEPFSFEVELPVRDTKEES